MVYAILIVIALVGIMVTWGATTDADSADVITRHPDLRLIA